jgi:hypothetical protein
MHKTYCGQSSGEFQEESPKKAKERKKQPQDKVTFNTVRPMLHLLTNEEVKLFPIC